MPANQPPSPDEYRRMLLHRRILQAEILALELAALQRRRDALANEPPVRRFKPRHPAREFLDEIAIREQVDPKDPAIPELRLKAAAADTFGWSHKTAIEKVRKNAERTDRRRTRRQDP